MSDWQDAQLGGEEETPEALPQPDHAAISARLTEACGREVTWTPEIEAAMERIFEG